MFVVHLRGTDTFSGEVMSSEKGCTLKGKREFFFLLVDPFSKGDLCTGSKNRK